MPTTPAALPWVTARRRSRTAQRVVPLLACAALLVSACGSTVQVRGGSAAGTAGGLGGQQLGESGTGGPAVPGSSTPATTGSFSSGRGGTGSTSGGAQGGGATGGVPGSTNGPPVGGHAAAATGPLKLGLLDASSPGAAITALGGTSPTGVDPVRLTKAFIHYYNAHGGMAGRQLVPVEYTIDPTSSSYETDLSAACARFTQDNHVRLVVSQMGNLFSGSYETCLTHAGVTNLEVANGAPDRQSFAGYPRLYTVGGPTVDRRETALLRGLHQSGLLTSKSNIGLVLEACPENVRAYDNTVAPLVKSFGLTVTRRDVDCVHGFSDAGAVTAQTQSTVLPFQSAGVDRVMFMSSFEAVLLQSFETQAKSQQYKPLYALSSVAIPAAGASQYAADQLSRMHGVGWLPIVDVTGIFRNAATRRCSDIARAEGITITSQADNVFLYQICELFAVLNASLDAAAGHDEPAAFQSGLGTISKSFVSAYQLGGVIRLDAQHHDNAEVFSLFGYQAGCACFRYTTAPAKLA